MMRLVPFSLLLLCACGSDGRLLISLERPEVQLFDPMSDVRLSRFNLRVIQGASQSDQETVRAETTRLRVGNVPVGEAFDLRLAGKSATGQMLGLGLVFDLNVSGEGDTQVAVKFRKPIGFVAGAQGIEQLDTTATTTGIIRLGQIPAPGAVDVVSSPAGDWIATISGSVLSVFGTSNQKKWPVPVTLPAPGTCLGVSPDSTYVVVCHASNRLSIVNMDRLAEGAVDVRDVPLGGSPTRVVFGQDRDLARVLINGQTYTAAACNAQSHVADVYVSTGRVGRDLQLPHPVSDVIVDPRDGRVLLAMPCDNAPHRRQLGRLGGTGGTEVEDTRVPVPWGIFDIALTEQYIVLVGTTEAIVPGGKAAAGESVLIDLTKQGYTVQKKPFGLPNLAVWTAGTSGQGELGWLLDIDEFKIYDISVSPDGQRALALFRATYSSDNVFGGNTYQTTMTVHGQMLVDLTIDDVVDWQMANLQFTRCNTTQHPNQADCDSWVRGALKKSGALANPEYLPRGGAVLFGGR